MSRLDRTGQDEEQAQANSLRRPPSKCSPVALPTLDPSVSPFRCDNLSFFAVVLLPTLAAKSQSESYRMKVRCRPLLSSVVMLISNFHLRSRLVHGCSPAFRPSSLHDSPSVPLPQSAHFVSRTLTSCRAFPVRSCSRSDAPARLPTWRDGSSTCAHSCSFLCFVLLAFIFTPH